MFGFGKRKSDEPKKPERARRSEESKERKSQSRAQLGFLAGVGDDGDIDNLMGNMDVGDDDLEEELAMLLDGNRPTAPRRPKTTPAPKRPSGSSSGGARPGGKSANLNFDVDDDGDDDDEDLDDPDLEAELGDILGIPTVPKQKADVPMEDDDSESDDSPPLPPPTMTKEQLLSLLQDRLDLYEKAKAGADSVNDSAKSRRFTRGIKTIKELLSKAKAGRVIDESEIPPAVSIGTKKETPSPSESVTPQLPENCSPSPVKFDEPSIPAIAPPRSPAKKVSIDSSNELITSLPKPLIPDPVFKSKEPEPIPSPQVVFPAVPEPSNQDMNSSIITVDPLVEERLKDYKRAAVAFKRQGAVQEAVQYLKLSKALEAAIKKGETIDLNNYPTVDHSTVNEGSSAIVQTDQPVPVSHPVSTEATQGSDATAGPAGGGGDDIFGAPPPPSSILEALEQRLQKYKSEVDKATEASNSSKARRMGRIVKQYEEAIGLHKKGKPVPYDELPTPPGFAAIPVTIPSTASSQTPVPQSSNFVPTPHQPIPSTSQSEGESPEKKSKPSPSPGPSSAASGQSPSGSSSSVSRAGKPSTKLTLQERQLQIITHRQKQFKEAALNAKKRGDVNQAREFLRTAKGFDKLIQVAQAGLPVDMATLPSAPDAVANLELEDSDNFEVVTPADCIMPSGSSAELYSKLEEDLKQQLKMCMRTRDHFKSIGDVASANRFESMALESKRDLDTIRLAMKKNGDIPKYHYETKIFSITDCNTDIAEDEIEVTILRGINYKVTNPSDVDTYIRVELPYPSADEAQSNKTQVVKDTNNPEYNASYKMSINRTARNFQRFVHRHGFKCEVWSKGGFLRGSTLIGTATVKLLPLETKCTLHDAFDVLDGRKNVGKLEVKVRIREPVLTKQITQKKEKWLSIDRA